MKTKEVKKVEPVKTEKLTLEIEPKLLLLLRAVAVLEETTSQEYALTAIRGYVKCSLEGFGLPD